MRLYKSGKLEGLFPGRAGVNAEAAGLAGAGLLEVVRTEIRGKSQFEWVRLMLRGVDCITSSNRRSCSLATCVLIRRNQEAIPHWIGEMRSTLQTLASRGRRSGAEEYGGASLMPLCEAPPHAAAFGSLPVPLLPPTWPSYPVGYRRPQLSRTAPQWRRQGFVPPAGAFHRLGRAVRRAGTDRLSRRFAPAQRVQSLAPNPQPARATCRNPNSHFSGWWRGAVHGPR